MSLSTVFRRAEPSLNGDSGVDHKSTNSTRLRGLTRFVVVNELVEAILGRDEEDREPDETEAKKHEVNKK